MPTCHLCNDFIPVGKDRCPKCAAPVPEAAVTGPSSLSGPGKNVISSGGNVEVHHDASTQTIHQTTHSFHQQQEDKSTNYDQRVTQTHGMHPLLVVSLVCVIVIGFAIMALILRHPVEAPPPMSAMNMMPTQSSVPVELEGKPEVSPVIDLPKSDPVKMSATPAIDKPEPRVIDSLPEQPAIMAAEVGIWKNGQFEPKSAFETGELLTLKLRVTQTCQVRVLYQPAQGNPMLMFPQQGAGSERVEAGRDVFIPDPTKLAGNAADATAFELFHDSGTGPAIEERLLVQVSNESFSAEDAVEVKDAPYRLYAGLSLAQARMRGVIKRLGAEAVQAQSRMETDLSQKVISFSIKP